MKTLVPAVLSAAVAMSAHAQSITNIGALPSGSFSVANGVSGDGTTVVGVTGGAVGGTGQAFRWSLSTGMVGIATGNEPSAFAANFDGQVVVGDVGDGAFVWSTAGGLQGVPVFAGDSAAHGVSGDGTVVAGFSGNSAFRWTAAGGAQNLGYLTGGNYAAGYAISSDGAAVVGRADVSVGRHAFRWTETTGMQSLGTLPGGLWSEAYGVSANGSVVVGYGGPSFVGGSGTQAFRWSEAGGMQGLGFVSGFNASYARAVSGDGSVVVGLCDSNLGSRAFLWHDQIGMVSLSEYLISRGVDLSGWEFLEQANSVSLDGRFIVGSGRFEGQTRAFIADIGVIPAPSAAPLLALAGLTTRGRRRK